MGSIAIVGLKRTDGGLPAPAIERVRQAAFVLLPTAEGQAAQAVRATGTTPVAFTEVGLSEQSSAEELLEVLGKLAEQGDIVVVTEERASAAHEMLAGRGCHGFDELVDIMAVLRRPEGGCPWDLEQDHMSIRGHLIEESYEAVAAIEEADDAALADELGDILLQVVFHAQIASEEGAFTIDDATARIVAKLRRRHPHIFGDAEARSAGEVLHRWEAIKREEKPGESVLASVPHALPALLRAQKISKKAAATGFDWETVDDVWVKVHEEIDELKATEPGSEEAVGEVGDVLFSVVNVARKLGIDAETALRVTCDRFAARFAHMEAAATASGTNIAALGIDEMESLWAGAKRAERAGETATPGTGKAETEERGV